MNRKNKSPLISRVELLLNPVFIVALVLLIFNDHFLKATHPSFVTGKLSDFAGLIVFPIFIVALYPSLLKGRNDAVLLHAGIGIAFILWKVTPVEILLDWFSKWSSLPVPSRAKDVSDLCALVVLPFSTWLMARDRRRRLAGSKHHVARFVTCVLLCAAGWSIMATSALVDPQYTCCEGLRGNVDYSPGDTVDIGDVTHLVSYLYQGGPAPECIMEADVDGSGDKNPIRAEDLDYLLDYLFFGGPAPPDCEGRE